MADLIAQAEQIFSKLKTKINEFKQKELTRIDKELQKVNVPSDAMKKLWDAAKTDFMSKMKSDIGNLPKIQQQVQSALGGKFSGDMISKSVDLLMGKAKSSIDKLTGQIDGQISKLGEKADKLKSQADKALADINSFNIDGKADELFEGAKKAISTAIAKNPESMFSGLNNIKKGLTEGASALTDAAGVMTEAVGQVESIVGSLPNVGGIDPNNFMSEFSQMSDKVKNITDTALLAQSELVNLGRFDSNNMTSLTSKLDELVSHIDGSSNLGMLKKIDGCKNALNLDTQLTSAVDKITPYISMAQDFGNNISAMSSGIPGNPVAMQFATKLGDIRSMFDGVKQQIPGMVGEIQNIINEDANIVTSEASKVYAQMQKAVSGFDKTIQSGIVRTNPVANIAKVNAMAKSLPMAQELKDISNATKQNLDYFKQFNPADVLNQASPIFSQMGKDAMDGLSNIASNLDVKNQVNGIMADTNKLRGQFDNFLANNLPKSELQNTINQVKPKIQGVLDAGNQALSDLENIKAPVDHAMGNISKMLKNHGYDNAVKDLMAGNYKNILTSSWDNAMLGTSLLQDLASMKKTFDDLKLDSKKLEDEIKTASNSVKVSMKRVENIVVTFATKAKRMVNQSNVRDTMEKRFNKIEEVVQKEIKKLKKR